MITPYKLIKGDINNIEAFEQTISDALEQGYELSHDLITQTVNDNIVLLQPMVFEEVLEFEDEALEFENS